MLKRIETHFELRKSDTFAMGHWVWVELKVVKTGKNMVFNKISAAGCQNSVFLATVLLKYRVFMSFLEVLYTHTPDRTMHFLNVRPKSVKNGQF